jgi:hypothetical protein
MSLALYFFALNFIAAVLYYRFGNDPEGTVMPAWTERLGYYIHTRYMWLTTLIYHMYFIFCGIDRCLAGKQGA